MRDEHGDRRDDTLWDFLLRCTSSEVNYRENESILAVSALWNNWLSTRADVFIARAVLTAIHAPKGDSIAKFLP